MKVEVERIFRVFDNQTPFVGERAIKTLVTREKEGPVLTEGRNSNN
jgi:hypothetical protein